ncbi:hypothetical protein PQX77_007417 [Marasmius sp. AFHP31]|nr:hypothetical protein PQX77_007417 [Marasmius sp. AFHP31]
MPSLPPHPSTPRTGDAHVGLLVCQWGFCRRILDSRRNLVIHIAVDHLPFTPSQPREDLQMLLRVEEGIGDSFSTGNTLASLSQLSDIEKKANDSQESAGARSLPSPPVSNHAMTPSSSPVHPPIHSEDDHLKRSYRSPSPFAPLPNPDSVSPFLFDEAPVVLSTGVDPDEDELVNQWTPELRLPSPTFAELSSSIPSSPAMLYDPPSPSLSALIDESVENRTKRKSPADGFDEEDQDSISSSESRRQVIEQLTCEEDERGEEGIALSHQGLSTEANFSTYMDHLSPVPTDLSSDHHPASPHISPDTPRQSLYSQPRAPPTYSMPSVSVPPAQSQVWYMPRRIRSQKQTRKGSSSTTTSAMQSPVDTIRPDHFALCQSQGLTQANDVDSMVLMSQAPYDSQAYAV